MLKTIRKTLSNLFTETERIHRHVSELHDEELHELFEVLIGEPISSDNMKISKFIRPGQGYVCYSFVSTKYSVGRTTLKEILRTAMVMIKDDYSIVIHPGADYKGNIDLFVEEAFLFLQSINCQRCNLDL